LLTEGGDADAPGASEVLVLDEYGDNRMIRTRRWKYVSRRRGPDELYDLDIAPQEEGDLSADPGFAAARADRSARLSTAFEPRRARRALRPGHRAPGGGRPLR